MDALPDFASLSDDDLALLIRGAEEEEEAISVRRRYLHARIDLLRGARVERLRDQVENGTLDLPAGGRSREPADPPRDAEAKGFEEPVHGPGHGRRVHGGEVLSGVRLAVPAAGRLPGHTRFTACAPSRGRGDASLRRSSSWAPNFSASRLSWPSARRMPPVKPTDRPRPMSIRPG